MESCILIAGDSWGGRLVINSALQILRAFRPGTPRVFMNDISLNEQSAYLKMTSCCGPDSLTPSSASPPSWHSHCSGTPPSPFLPSKPQAHLDFRFRLKEAFLPTQDEDLHPTLPSLSPRLPCPQHLQVVPCPQQLLTDETHTHSF